MRGFILPSHSTDLEVAQVAAVLLLTLAREFRCEEGHGRHRRCECINVVLGEVPASTRPQLVKWQAQGEEHTRVAYRFYSPALLAD